MVQPLSNAISNGFPKSIFPDNAEIAMVLPLDKGTSKKNDISNFRPVGVLTVFSKIYEHFIKAIVRYSYEEIIICFHFCLSTKS